MQAGTSTSRPIAPHDPLAPFVDSIWFSRSADGARSARSATWERALPAGAAHLVIRLGDDPIRIRERDGANRVFGSAVLCGPRSDWYERESSRASRTVGVQLRPGGLAAVLGVREVPAAELAERHWPLADLLGARADALVATVRRGGSPPSVLDRLHAALARLAESARPIHPAIRAALATIEADPSSPHVVERAWRDSGFSRRHFIELFRRDVGLAPKTLARTRRFQRALRIAAESRAATWTRIAQDSGAYDQSHLIREFRAFAGMAPGEWRVRAVRHPGHVPIDPAAPRSTLCKRDRPPAR